MTTVDDPVKTRKKLIEVALPLDAISEEGSRRKRKAPGGYPTTLHKWWAQRPVAAARAVVFAQMVDDPSDVPEEFPTEADQDRERQRLFRIIEELVLWENTANEEVLERARAEIRRSWKRACADNAGDPRAIELLDPNKLPAFHDPFAGSGALPLEAQRLGLETYASDLNPVAVLINKAMIEIPPKFAGRPPANPEAREDRSLFARDWKCAYGLAEDVRFYGKWMSDEAAKRVGHLYPKIEVTADMATERPDLEPYVGRQLTVIAWLWARTVRSPNPAFAHVCVPLASTFTLSTKAGKEAYVEPIIEDGGYRFKVRVGQPNDEEATKNGTKLSRGANFRCLMSGTPIAPDHIYTEANAGRMGARLMAIVAEGDRGRVYLAPTPEHEAAALEAVPTWKPEVAMPENPRWFSPPLYGLKTYGDLFTPRQLVALTTLSDLVQEARDRVKSDAIAAGLPDGKSLQDGGANALAYAEAVCTFLSLAVSRLADYGSSIATWRPKDSAMRSTMPKQAIQMTWDFAEGSPFGNSSSGFLECAQVISRAALTALGSGPRGVACQASAVDTRNVNSGRVVISTDPPYYDNIGYGDLSDFFFLWLRRSLQSVFPDLFSTLAVPKAEELVATPYRHGSKEEAESFFLNGMTRAMQRLAEKTHPSYPVTIYYAFKQAEKKSSEGTSSTGWETFLDALISAGFAISGTWPVRTEGDNRSVGIGTNALASSIVLVCRRKAVGVRTATRREFVTRLKSELPQALGHLQRANIAPVDLAQAAIGPGMAIFTRFDKVLDAGGRSLTVRDALALINQTLDEALAEQEGDFDADTRWALTWFEQQGFSEGEYGAAETLATARNTSVQGLVEAGIAFSARGKVRLLAPTELAKDWDPTTDHRLTHWDAVHHLIRVLEADGETAAAELVERLEGRAETARELAYRLYTVCERRNRAKEALLYNGLVQSWPEMQRLARNEDRNARRDTPLFGEA